MSFLNDAASSISLVVMFWIHCGKAKERKQMLIHKRNDSAMDERIHKRNCQPIETREIEKVTQVIEFIDSKNLLQASWSRMWCLLDYWCPQIPNESLKSALIMNIHQTNRQIYRKKVPIYWECCSNITASTSTNNETMPATHLWEMPRISRINSIINRKNEWISESVGKKCNKSIWTLNTQVWTGLKWKHLFLFVSSCEKRSSNLLQKL